MLEPDFSEPQLQQAVNSALIRLIFEKRGEWVFVSVPSLFDEFGLGWDSALFFPWLHHPALEEHEGCNFFIQYKLSYELASRSSGQWNDWKEPYLRFKIPHSTKGLNGKYRDDYHQWERLKELAKNNYPTFYATNSILSRHELIYLSKNGDLLHHTPFLDVRNVANIHKYVTFTAESPSFKLHSEVEESFKVNINMILDRLDNTEKTSLEESNRLLYSSLKKIEVKDESWQADLRQISDLLSGKNKKQNAWSVRLLLGKFMSQHIGVQLFWYQSRS